MYEETDKRIIICHNRACNIAYTGDKRGDWDRKKTEEKRIVKTDWAHILFKLKTIGLKVDLRQGLQRGHQDRHNMLWRKVTANKTTNVDCKTSHKYMYQFVWKSYLPSSRV